MALKFIGGSVGDSPQPHFVNRVRTKSPAKSLAVSTGPAPLGYGKVERTPATTPVGNTIIGPYGPYNPKGLQRKPPDPYSYDYNPNLQIDRRDTQSQNRVNRNLPSTFVRPFKDRRLNRATGTPVL